MPNRHERRTVESITRKFQNGLVSTVLPYQPHEQEVITAFLKDVARHQKETGTKTYPRVFGAFGEFIGSDGFIEKVVEKEDGKYFKLWGNSFLLKALPDRSVLKTTDLAKWLLSDFPRVVGRQFAISLAFKAIFRKKRFINLCDYVLWTILTRNTMHVEVKELHRPAKELRRAAYKVIKDQYGLEYGDDIVEGLKSSDNVKYASNQFGYLLLRLARFLTFFLEIDTAYMFRVQDAFGGIKFGGIDAFWMGLDTLIRRETSVGVGPKWKFIKIALRLGLWRYPELKRFLDAFFDEVDMEKVKMDENEQYFCLGYVSYNFGGLTKEERYAYREQIDVERKHVYLKK
jgi:hypothetical protein